MAIKKCVSVNSQTAVSLSLELISEASKRWQISNRHPTVATLRVAVHNVSSLWMYASKLLEEVASISFSSLLAYFFLVTIDQKTFKLFKVTFFASYFALENNLSFPYNQRRCILRGVNVTILVNVISIYLQCILQ